MTLRLRLRTALRVGAAASTNSIGCVCKVSWSLARGNALRQLEARLRQELGLR